MNALACSQVGSRPAVRASSNVGASASRSEITSSCPLGQSMANAGSVASTVCSRCGLYSAEQRYITVELSCSARKPCPSPSERYTDLWLRSSSTTASQRPNVGDPTRMSTTTSNTEPDRHVTYLAWLGGSWAKCRPRSTPAADTEQLACRTSSRWPAKSVKARSVSHSKNNPRESECSCGVISHAPAMSSSRTSTSLTPLFVTSLDGIFERPPPRFVAAIPVNGGTQAVDEFGMLWHPT